jgi:1,4-alpha-glucan branching enzyme
MNTTGSLQFAAGSYKVVLNTDNPLFDGHGLIDESIEHFTQPAPEEYMGKQWLKLYVPARSAFVLKKQ